MSAPTVSAERQAALARHLAEAGVRESDLDETFVRSGGPGGQNVNKTATCVVLLHRPTGIQVKCQSSRHQGLNRFLARHLLLARIESLRREKAAQQRAEREKARRQRRGRSRAAKEHMLADKAHRAARKKARHPARIDPES